MRFFGDGLGQQAALVKTDISRRCADQTADRMALHVLTHVKAQQLNTHDVGQLLGRFSFAHAGGATEQERANRLIRPTQPGAGHFDRRGQYVERFVLTKNHAFEIAI